MLLERKARAISPAERSSRANTLSLVLASHGHTIAHDELSNRWISGQEMSVCMSPTTHRRSTIDRPDCPGRWGSRKRRNSPGVRKVVWSMAESISCIIVAAWRTRSAAARSTRATRDAFSSHADERPQTVSMHASGS